MDYFDYEKVMKRVKELSLEDKLMIIYYTMEELENGMLESISKESFTRISPTVIARTIVLLSTFEETLKHAYLLEEKRSQQEDINNSNAYILR